MLINKDKYLDMEEVEEYKQYSKHHNSFEVVAHFGIWNLIRFHKQLTRFNSTNAQRDKYEQLNYCNIIQNDLQNHGEKGSVERYEYLYHIECYYKGRNNNSAVLFYNNILKMFYDSVVEQELIDEIITMQIELQNNKENIIFSSFVGKPSKFAIKLGNIARNKKSANNQITNQLNHDCDYKLDKTLLNSLNKIDIFKF